MKYGYIRVSTKEQDETRQLNIMQQLNIPREHIYIDKASGYVFDRENWVKLLSKVVIGDTIVIKELDRLGRNKEEIKNNYKLLADKGVFIEFIDDSVLNTYGKSKIEIELIQPLVLHLLGYYAEKERENLLKRQREAYNSLKKDEKGRMISRKKNKVVGRPNKQENLTQEQKIFLQSYMNKKLKLRDCIRLTSLSRATIYRIKSKIKKRELKI